MRDPGFSLHVGRDTPPRPPNTSRTERFNSVFLLTVDRDEPSERFSNVSTERLDSVLARVFMSFRALTFEHKYNDSALFTTVNRSNSWVLV